MKNKFSLCLIIIIRLSCFHAFSQICTPDQSNQEPGIYPSQISEVVVDVPFTFTLQTRIPTDTSIQYAGNTIALDINYSQVISIEGMPTGFNYECSNADCKFSGGSAGCLTISGTATADMYGNHPLKIIIKTNGTIQGTTTTLSQTDTVNTYSLSVVMTAGVEMKKKMFNQLILSPNPAKNLLGITINNNAPKKGLLQLFDLTGKQIYAQTYNTNKGYNHIVIDVSTIPRGIYLCSFSYENSRAIKKVMLE